MTAKRRLIRILERAAKERERRPLTYDACEMIYCALMESNDDNLGNAEFELGLSILCKPSSGILTQERADLHHQLAAMRELYFML